MHIGMMFASSLAKGDSFAPFERKPKLSYEREGNRRLAKQLAQALLEP